MKWMKLTFLYKFQQNKKENALEKSVSTIKYFNFLLVTLSI